MTSGNSNVEFAEAEQAREAERQVNIIVFLLIVNFFYILCNI